MIRYRISSEKEVSDLRKMLEVANLEIKQAERAEKAKEVKKEVGLLVEKKSKKGNEVKEMHKQRQEMLKRIGNGGNPSLCDDKCPMVLYL